VLRELLKIFRADEPLPTATHKFSQMLRLTQEMLLEASEIYWTKAWTPKQRTALYKKDVKVNKLERKIRKLIIAHLTMSPAPTSVPYALLVMSLVKDVERLGDYAKNIAEVVDLQPAAMPDDERVTELREIREAVEMLIREAPDVFARGDEERATELTVEGRTVAKRCDEVVWDIAAADYDGRTAVALTLGARFYKRIEGHLLNLLSGVIMPLHKLDYFDEKYLKQDDD
jgi:phosphate uptake regulator